MEDNIAIEENLKKMEKIISNSQNILSKVENKNSKSVTSLLEKLKTLKRDLQDQTRKLLKNNYELAVVGRENAGKSTLLNAWMQSDLLPTDHNRCTYTTTEIRSCNENDQKYQIEYFNKSELENLKSKFDNFWYEKLSKEVIEKRLWEKRLKSRLKMPTSGGQASRLKGENVEVQRPGVRMLSSNNRTPRQVEGGDGEGVRLL